MNTTEKYLLLWSQSMVQTQTWEITHHFSMRYGEALRLVHVGGYPKSGTSWLSKLVASYLNTYVVELGLAYAAVAPERVVHHHWNYDARLDHSIQILRDGRDVMVALFMNVMKDYRAIQEALTSLGNKPARLLIANVGNYAYTYRRLNRLFGNHFDSRDAQRHLPLFIEADMKQHFVPHMQKRLDPWPKYTLAWRDRSSCTTFVKYEDLLSNGERALSNALGEYLSTDQINHEEVKYALRRNSFEKLSGRTQGVEDPSSDMRKGIQGDWKNHFSKEARQIFDHYAGETLISLEYEPDHNWVNKDS